MTQVHTAILHLRDAVTLPGGTLHDRLRSTRGVMEVTIEEGDRLIAVRFDDALVGLADLVRTVEDSGRVVSSVAQRRSES